MLLCINGLGLQAQERTGWSQVPIGGGGRTFGFIGSPSSDMLYLRTDVAGMYKKLPADPAWTRLTDSFDPTYGERMEGCAGLGLHPNTDDILYAALSRGIYKSTDGGTTWNQSLNLRVFTNGFPDDRDDRNYGEALVVDRANGEVVYYGSQDQGLYYTRDGGGNWTQLPGTDFPTLGSRSIVVDHTRERVDIGTPNERSKYVYVTVKTQGIYRSEDGGNTFSQWTATLPGGPSGVSGNYVRYLRISKDGELYAAHDKGLARWNGSIWEDISPTVGPGGTNVEVRTVATDPLDNNVVICSRARYDDATGTRIDAAIYRSNDRGDTWEEVPTQVGSIAGWGRGRYEPNQVNAFSIYIDDQASAPANRAYVSSSYHAWKTDDIWAPVTTWDAMQEGNEMTINITGTSLPGTSRARLLTGMADVRGFVYYEDDLDQYPGSQTVIPESLQSQGFFTPNFPGIDFCESNPGVVWFTASRVPGYVPLVFRSTNGGDLLDEVSNPSIGTSFENIGEGGPSAGGPKIAVSASDPDNAVVLIKKNLRYTKDGGLTWSTPSGVSTINSGLDSNIEYEFDDLVQSDRVNGNTFYVYDRNGEFYRSYDGGETFSKVTTENLPSRGSIQGGFAAARGGGAKMATAPGIEGELWISTGSNGIWKANGAAPNRTDTFEEITFFQRLNPTCVTFGAPRPGSTTPTVYVSGARRADGLWGIWKSEDLGESWSLITPIDVPGQWIRNLYGDREVFGRVFVGDASFGVRMFTFQDDTVEDIIVDNDTPGFQTQGTWATGNNPNQQFGPNFRVNRTNSAGTATYRPGIVEAGTYNVYARWVSSGDRDSRVEIDINNGSATQTMVVDQKQNGGQWVQIGAVDLAAGNSSFVRINNDIVTPVEPGKTQSVTVADAVRWEYVNRTPPLRPSGLKTNSINTNSLELEWFDNATNEDGFIIERSTDDGPFAQLDTVAANGTVFRDNAIEFNKIYRYSVRAFNAFGESTKAFVAFNNSEVIIDNNTPGFQTQGTWAFATFAPVGQRFLGNNYRVNRTTAPGAATYTTGIEVTGIYNLYSRWISVSDRDNNVHYEVNNGNETDTVVVDQTKDGGKWVLLKTLVLRAGDTSFVRVNNDTTPSKVTVADAVRYEYVQEYRVEKLKLTSMCSDDPSTGRRWRVRNPNSFEVPVYWQVYGTSIDGNITALPGDNFFFTPTVPGANTVKITWQDENGVDQSTVKASGGATCSATAARQGDPGEILAPTGQQIMVYPNPSRLEDDLQIVLTPGSKDVSSLDLVNMEGKHYAVDLQSVIIKNNTISVPLSDLRLAPGLYFLHITGENINQVQTFKVLVK